MFTNGTAKRTWLVISCNEALLKITSGHSHGTCGVSETVQNG